MKTVDVNGYIIPKEEIHSRTTSEHGVTYSIVYETETDFIINRKAAKTERELVVLPSKDLCYIKEKTAGTSTSISLETIKVFFNRFRGVLRFEKLEWLNDELTHETISKLRKIISDSTCLDMIRNHVLHRLGDFGRQHWHQDKDILLYISKRSSAKRIASGVLQALIRICQEYSLADAKYLADRYLDNAGSAEISYVIRCLEYLKEIHANANIRDVLDYLMISLYKQGCAVGYITCSNYNEYLHMQQSYYGRVEQLYPEDFQKSYNQMELRTMLYKKIATCNKFIDNLQPYAGLTWHDENSANYAVTLPQSTKALIDLGISHGYSIVPDIIGVDNGKFGLLLFSHDYEGKSETLVIKVNGDQVLTVTGDEHRALTDEELTYLRAWAKEKNMKLPKEFAEEAKAA